MGKIPGVVARCGTRAWVVITVAAGGLAAVAGPAYAALPTISGVVVAGSTTNKVVTGGTTVVITGTGFGGMTDNAAATPCSAAAVAWPAAGSGCSQVRFLGVGATASAGYTLATRYTVVSDTQIFATVPAIIPSDGTTAGSPAAGTGSIRVQVANTTGTGASSGVSASTASELFYRHPLTAVISGPVNANPLGGGTLAVRIAGGVAPMTALSFPRERITAYLSSTVAGSPQVAPAAVAWRDADEVDLTLPAHSATGDFVGVMLVHDGVAGTADTTHLKFPAVITNIQSCSTAAAAVRTWIGAPTTTFPTCTGTANAPTSGAASLKITGKGLTSSAATWSFDGIGGTVAETCLVVSDTTVFCHIVVTTPPPSGVAAVTFTPTAVGTSAAPALVPTAGAIVLFSTLV